MIQVGYWQSLTRATGTADAAAVLMVILLGCSVSALCDCGLLLLPPHGECWSLAATDGVIEPLEKPLVE